MKDFAQSRNRREERQRVRALIGQGEEPTSLENVAPVSAIALERSVRAEHALASCLGLRQL